MQRSQRALRQGAACRPPERMREPVPRGHSLAAALTHHTAREPTLPHARERQEPK